MLLLTFKLFRIALLGLLILAFAPTAAQDSTEWEAIIHRVEDGVLLRVDSNGVVQDIVNLPTVFGFQTPQNVAVARDGGKVAYVLASTESEQRSLVVYDMITGAIRLNYRLPSSSTLFAHSINYNPTPFSFDPTGRYFAFSTFADMQWSLMVFDLETASIVTEITAESVSARSAGLPSDLLPVPRNLQQDTIDLTFSPIASEGLLNAPSYTFDRTTGSFAQNAAYRSLSGDILARTNEVVFATRDERLPNRDADIIGIGWHNNTLHVHAQSRGVGTFPVYNDRDNILFRANFIQGGERVLVRTQQINADAASWRVINRQGSSVGTLPIQDARLGEIEGTTDGFVFIAESEALAPYLPALSSTPGTWALIHMNTQSSVTATPGQVIWRSSGSTRHRLAWLSDTGAATPLSDWSQLLGPLTAADFSAGASAAPKPTRTEDDGIFAPAALSVGGTARINTTEGDRANLRSGPGTSFGIVSQLFDGTDVQLLEGPVSGGGFRWWRVRASGGQEGWIVEAADNVEVLVPLSSGDPNATPPPTTGPTATPEPGISRGFSIGDQVVVTGFGDNLNVRTSPNVDAPKTDQLATGDILTITGGPTQTTYYTWWQIQRGSLTGWVAAGSSTRYWLDFYTGPPPTAPAAATPALAAPTSRSPIDGASFSNSAGTLTFSWAPVSGARSYILELQECVGITTVTCTDFNTYMPTGTSVTVNFGSKAFFRGRWRVRAVGDGDVQGPPTSWHSVNYTNTSVGLGTPTLLSPANGATFDIFPRTMTYTWSSVPGATRYEIQVQHCQGSLPSPTNCTGGITEVTTTSYTSNFVGAQPGRWRVRALNDSGDVSLWPGYSYFEHNQ